MQRPASSRKFHREGALSGTDATILSQLSPRLNPESTALDLKSAKLNHKPDAGKMAAFALLAKVYAQTLRLLLTL